MAYCYNPRTAARQAAERMDQREASRTPVVHTTGRIPGKVKRGHVIEHVHPRITKSTVIQVSQAHEDHGDPSDQARSMKSWMDIYTTVFTQE